MKQIYRSYGSYGSLSARQVLAALGYDTGMTREDISKFQSDWGLVSTGRIDANTADVMELVYEEQTGETTTVQEEKPSSAWKWIAIGVGTVGVVGIVLYASKKKR